MSKEEFYKSVETSSNISQITLQIKHRESVERQESKKLGILNNFKKRSQF